MYKMAVIRFSLKGPLTRHNSLDATYLLKSRQYIYCVHREVITKTQRHGDGVPTKSCILGFRFKKHAETMCKTLNDYQTKGRNIDNIVRDGGIMQLEKNLQGRPISHLNIDSVPLESVEKQCLMNYLDLWLVHDIDCLAEDDWRLDVYEYMTVEPPHRSYINHQFERLLRGRYMR